MQRPAGSDPHAAPRGAPYNVATQPLQSSQVWRARSSVGATTEAPHLMRAPRCTAATALVTLDSTTHCRSAATGICLAIVPLAAVQLMTLRGGTACVDISGLVSCPASSPPRGSRGAATGLVPR